MKKLISFVLALFCILGLSGCNTKADFDNFSDYEDDFDAVVQFVLEYVHQRNSVDAFTVDIGDDNIKIDDTFQSDEALSPSIKKIREKGFTYIEVAQDYMIFWEDETGYYGVLWAEKPTEEINSIREDSRPYMKSRKLSKEWYEVGALDSI